MAVEARSFFHADQHLCYADVLSPPEVLARIEVVVLRFLRSLTSTNPSIDDLSLICRTDNNTILRQGCFGEFDSIFLSSTTYKRSFMKLNMGKAFVRVWKVLEICVKILSERKQATQREIFYMLLCDSPKYFSKQEHVNKAIQDVVALVQCSRNSLGIVASSRGEVIGRLLIHEPNGNAIDCTFLGPTGHVINGNLDIMRKSIFETDAHYIILVEKDAVFQRLAEDRIFHYVPSIMISGKGYPDLASRFLLHQLSKSFPSLRIFAVVDWYTYFLSTMLFFSESDLNHLNGFLIQGTQPAWPFYVLTSLEASLWDWKHQVMWLGLRKEDLQLVPERARLDLKLRDRQLAKSLLKSKMLQNQKKYKDELSHMINAGYRVEIEALYAHGYDFLVRYIARKIVQNDCI